MKNKKGSELVSNETIELILAAAGIFILLLILWALIYPTWNRQDETAKAYIDSLKQAIKDADNGGVGEISIFPVKEGSTNNEKTFYTFIYFKDEFTYDANLENTYLYFFKSVTTYHYFVAKSAKNQFCVCPINLNSKDIKCTSCTSLSKPAALMIMDKNGNPVQLDPFGQRQFRFSYNNDKGIIITVKKQTIPIEGKNQEAYVFTNPSST